MAVAIYDIANYNTTTTTTSITTTTTTTTNSRTSSSHHNALFVLCGACALGLQASTMHLCTVDTYTHKKNRSRSHTIYMPLPSISSALFDPSCNQWLPGKKIGVARKNV